MKIRKLSPDDQRMDRRQKNMLKHMRLANALPMGYQRNTHIEKAKALLSKYQELDATNNNKNSVQA